MSVLELVAAATGLVSVWLTVKESIWCWPVGAVMVGLYAYLFWRAKLYADSGLQVVYFVLQFYGWYEWARGGRGDAALAVSRVSAELLALLGVLGLAGTLTLGFVLARWTDQRLPYRDSAITVFSLLAQWMLAHKLLENWLVWIGVDALAVTTYYSRKLYPTAGLYAIFLILALAGYGEWRDSLATAAAPHAETSREAE